MSSNAQPPAIPGAFPEPSVPVERPKTAEENIAKANADAAAKLSSPDPTAPVAPRTGPITVTNADGRVAVDTKTAWKSFTIWATTCPLIGLIFEACFGGVVLPELQKLITGGTPNWNQLLARLGIAAYFAVLRYRRLNDNSAIRTTTTTTVDGEAIRKTS